jgi:predicted small secreted protein
MKRGGTIAVVCAAATVLAGCSNTAEDIAKDDASRKATAIGKEIHGTRNLVWTAEDLGRRAAARDDMTLLGVSGKDVQDGVTLTMKVSGTGAEPDWFDSGDDAQTFDFCFDVKITRYGGSNAKSVQCPTTPPVTYAPLPPPPQLPTIEDLAKVLSGVTDEATARAALAKLDIDDRIMVDLVVKDGTVGVALKAIDTAARQMDCRMARVLPNAKKPEVWRPASVYLQPGEMSCSAAEAAGGGGQRPPH